MRRHVGVHNLSGENRLIIRNFGYSGIYFFGWEGDDEDAPIKVGVSERPFERFSSMQIANWRQINVRDILWLKSRPHTKDWTPLVNWDGVGVGYHYSKRRGDGYIPAIEIERHCHKVLKAEGLHCRGEWFNGGMARLIATVKTQVSEHFKHECFGHSSMLRRLKMWKEEAALDSDARVNLEKAKQPMFQQHGLKDPAYDMPGR